MSVGEAKEDADCWQGRRREGGGDREEEQGGNSRGGWRTGMGVGKEKAGYGQLTREGEGNK